MSSRWFAVLCGLTFTVFLAGTMLSMALASSEHGPTSAVAAESLDRGKHADRGGSRATPESPGSTLETLLGELRITERTIGNPDSDLTTFQLAAIDNVEGATAVEQRIYASLMKSLESRIGSIKECVGDRAVRGLSLHLTFNVVATAKLLEVSAVRVEADAGLADVARCFEGFAGGFRADAQDGESFLEYSGPYEMPWTL